MSEPCVCRCHVNDPHGHTKCCPECDPDAYDACGKCGRERYEHYKDESSGASCGSFSPYAARPKLVTP